MKRTLFGKGKVKGRATTASASEVEAERRHRNFTNGTWNTVGIDVAFAVYFFYTGQLPVLATVLAANAVIQAAGFFWYLRNKDIDSAFERITFGGTAVTLALYFVWFHGTAIYFITAHPPITFLMNGYERGRKLVVYFFIGTLAIIAGKALGFFETPYSIAQHVMSIISAGFVAILSFAGESAQEGFRREIVAQRERLSTILRRLPVGVVVFDAPSGRVSVANDVAAGLLGKPVGPSVVADAMVEEFGLRKEDGTALGAEDLPPVIALRKRKETVAEWHVGSSEHPRVLSAIGAPVRGADGKVSSAVLVLEDTTKRYEVDKMKSEFVSLASHQLKTPLSALSWAIEAAVEEDPSAPPIPEDRRKMLSYAEEIIGRMKTLVSDLLNVSRIETGRKFDTHPAPVDGVALLRESAKGLGGMAAQRSIVMDSSSLPPTAVAIMDEVKMREVFTNLLSNAVKYSRDGGTVRMGASPDGDAMVFTVADQGLGIPADARDRIFTKFYRAPNVIEGIEGTGLGLYIVKAVVEKLGGTVRFESEEGKGTTFFVRLPTLARKESM